MIRLGRSALIGGLAVLLVALPACSNLMSQDGVVGGRGAVAGASAPDFTLSDLEGRKVSEQIAETVGKVGENIVPKRVARLEVGGGRVGGYVHAGGKLGVLVACAPTPPATRWTPWPRTWPCTWRPPTRARWRWIATESRRS